MDAVVSDAGDDQFRFVRVREDGVREFGSPMSAQRVERAAAMLNRDLRVPFDVIPEDRFEAWKAGKWTPS